MLILYFIECLIFSFTDVEKMVNFGGMAYDTGFTCHKLYMLE